MVDMLYIYCGYKCIYLCYCAWTLRKQRIQTFDHIKNQYTTRSTRTACFRPKESNLICGIENKLRLLIDTKDYFSVE